MPLGPKRVINPLSLSVCPAVSHRVIWDGRLIISTRLESTFEDSNHNIHSTSDTIDHPEFSFDHMKEWVDCLSRGYVARVTAVG